MTIFRVSRTALNRFRRRLRSSSLACRLVSRNAHVYKSFHGLCASLAELSDEAIPDGEIVCLDRDGQAAVRSAFLSPPSRISMRSICRAIVAKWKYGAYLFEDVTNSPKKNHQRYDPESHQTQLNPNASRFAWPQRPTPAYHPGPHKPPSLFQNPPSLAAVNSALRDRLIQCGTRPSHLP
jgi:hypothetical protein